MKNQVCALANVLRWKKGLTPSEAMAKAWKVIKLKSAMKEGKAQFSYTKKDGSTRAATGTTNSIYFQYERKTDRPAPAGLVTYFDLEKNAFRAFNAENIL
jgi:hypothetical protein